MLLGLFQKSVIADGLLAPYVEQIYDAGSLPTTLTAWAATLAFSGQIFCDFAGYSTAAIGIAMCLGFQLPDNFRFPYAALGFSDFWRRWHVSLSTWLRDYLYISLGGNRHGTIRTYTNLMLTMLIGGLWHGASWTFVAWGGLHGLFLAMERWIRARIAPRQLWKRTEIQFLVAMLTFALICITWVFFRADGFPRAMAFVSAMVGWGRGDLSLPRLDVVIIFLTTGLIVALHWVLRNTTLEFAVRKVPWWVKSIALSGMSAAIVMMPGEDRAFIYFQF